MRSKGRLIRPSQIEFGSPIFVCKAYGSLRHCIDYRGLSEVTYDKDAYPLPRVDDVDELKDAKSYIHLDLPSILLSSSA
jgi:hypothetical protein